VLTYVLENVLQKALAKRIQAELNKKYNK
jgi:hypothetical protein